MADKPQRTSEQKLNTALLDLEFGIYTFEEDDFIIQCNLFKPFFKQLGFWLPRCKISR